MDLHVARTARFAHSGHLATFLTATLIAVLLSSLGSGARLARAASPSAPFLWGAATSSYQVEGGINCKQPSGVPFVTYGQAYQGSGIPCNDYDFFNGNGGIHRTVFNVSKVTGHPFVIQAAGAAVDFWDPNVYRQDFDNARALGMNSFRISLEWSRIEPQQGVFDQTAIDGYVQMLKEMRARGLTPIVTLWHFALPIWALMPPQSNCATPCLPGADAGFNSSLGGWENPALVDAYVDYVNHIVPALKDQVDIWLTINEPMGYLQLGYAGGVWSPGFVLDGARIKRALPNLISAHVRGYDAIKAIYGTTQVKVGFAHAMLAAVPSDSRWANRVAAGNFSYFNNDFFVNAVTNGWYDVGYLDNVTQSSQVVNHPEWAQHLDFLGINYYRRVHVSYNSVLAGAGLGFMGGSFTDNLNGTSGYGLLNDMGWEIYPQGLHDMIMKAKNNWNMPVLITENGMPEATDHNRAPYIVAHVDQVRQAMSEGATVLGYMYWSMMDNWELSSNYFPQSQFGLYHVDRNQPTSRYITNGAAAFQELIRDSVLTDPSGAPTAAGLGVAQARFGTILSDGSAIVPPTTFPPVSGGVALRADGRSGYTVDGYGNITAFGGAPAVASPATWPGWNIVRGIALAPNGTSGYVLDGWGGIHPFGGAPELGGYAYWPNWDIARAIVLDPDGLGGQVLDGWGGIHPFGNAVQLTATAYWSGWDIARAIALDPDGAGGQVLDGWGGLHPFGNASPVSGGPYWNGWDIARGVALLGNGSSGYVLDGWGALHPFGAAQTDFSPPLNYHPSSDIARGVAAATCAGSSQVCAAVMTLGTNGPVVQTLTASPLSNVSSTIRHPSSWDPFSSVSPPGGSPGRTTAIAAASGLNGDVQYAVVANDDVFDTIRHADGSWDPYVKLNAPSSPTAVAAAPGLNGDVQLAVVAGGTLYHTIRHADGTWDPFGNVYGQSGNPGPAIAVAAAAGLNGDVQFAIVTSGGGVFHTIRHTYGWDPFRDVYSQTGNPGPATAVAAAPDGSGDVQFAIVTGGTVFHTIRHAYGWDPFRNVYDQTGNSVPATAIAAAQGLNGDVQFAVVTSGGGLFHTIRHPSSWDPLRNVYDQTGTPGLAQAVSAAPGLNGDVQFTITLA